MVQKYQHGGPCLSSLHEHVKLAAQSFRSWERDFLQQGLVAVFGLRLETQGAAMHVCVVGSPLGTQIAEGRMKILRYGRGCSVGDVFGTFVDERRYRRRRAALRGSIAGRAGGVIDMDRLVVGPLYVVLFHMQMLQRRVTGLCISSTAHRQSLVVRLPPRLA